jgi:hypothetical protein
VFEPYAIKTEKTFACAQPKITIGVWWMAMTSLGTPSRAVHRVWYRLLIGRFIDSLTQNSLKAIAVNAKKTESQSYALGLRFPDFGWFLI